MTECPFCEGDPADLDDDLKAYIGKQCSRREGGPCHSCRDYIDLEKRIQDAKTMLENLVAQRPKILSKINHLHDPITRLLPTEIISLIFHHSLPANWNGFEVLNRTTDYKALVSGPLFLGSVCRAWRHIAWSLPSMWTVIRVFMDSRDKYLDRRDVARDWLKRAGMLPLSIRIVFWPYYCVLSTELQFLTPVVFSVIDVVNQSSSRWNDLEIAGPIWLFAKICEGICRAPNLRTLRASSDDEGDQVLLKGHHFRPTHVELDEVHIHTFNIDWSHVTHVSVLSPFSDVCVELLRIANRLLHCKIKGVNGDSERFKFPTQPIVQSTLQTLCVHAKYRYSDFTPEDYDVILDSLTLPSLCTAEMVGPSPECLLTLITRSSCSITSLTLCVNDFGKTLSPVSLLSKIPTLQHLSLKMLEEPWTASTTALDLYPVLDRLALPSGSNFPDNNQSYSNLDTDTDHITFLPNFQSLELLGFSDSAEFWRRLSHIFGPDAAADLRPIQRRPLKKLRVDWDQKYVMEYGYIDKSSTLKFMQVRYDGGVNLDFRDTSFKDDFLDISIQHHVTSGALQDPESEVNLSLETIDVSEPTFCSVPPLGL